MTAILMYRTTENVCIRKDLLSHGREILLFGNSDISLHPFLLELFRGKGHLSWLTQKQFTSFKNPRTNRAV